MTVHADELAFMSALDLRAALRARSVSSLEIVEDLLERIDRLNGPINAFVTLLADEATAAARRADAEVSSRPADELGALHGIPLVVKDLTPTAGVRTTFGSSHYRDHVPDHDSVAWARLKTAGAILLGKTTTPEFGMLGVTESPLTGVTATPWDSSRTSGGSSGGSAAACAYGFAPLAWGSDGGGSIRVPASFCGVVGLKATPGRIPGYGELGPFESVVTVGPLTRSVADAALMLTVTAGPQSREPFTLPDRDVDYVAPLAEASIRGLRIAYCPSPGEGRIAGEVADAVRTAARTFEHDLGARVDEVTLDLPDQIDYFKQYWSPALAMAIEDGELGEDWDPASSHPTMATFNEWGRSMAATDYVRVATTTRQAIVDQYAAIFDSYDLLLCPTTPVAPFLHPGPEAGNRDIDGHPVRHPELDFHRLTEPPSHACLPAISVPCGFTPGGLPVGLQIVAPWRSDAAALNAAAAYEAATDWHERRPPEPPSDVVQDEGCAP